MRTRRQQQLPQRQLPKPSLAVPVVDDNLRPGRRVVVSARVMTLVVIIVAVGIMISSRTVPIGLARKEPEHRIVAAILDIHRVLSVATEETGTRAAVMAGPRREVVDLEATVTDHHRPLLVAITITTGIEDSTGVGGIIHSRIIDTATTVAVVATREGSTLRTNAAAAAAAADPVW